jgi:hypothetical protein
MRSIWSYVSNVPTALSWEYPRQSSLCKLHDPCTGVGGFISRPLSSPPLFSPPPPFPMGLLTPPAGGWDPTGTAPALQPAGASHFSTHLHPPVPPCASDAPSLDGELGRVALDPRALSLRRTTFTVFPRPALRAPALFWPRVTTRLKADKAAGPTRDPSPVRLRPSVAPTKLRAVFRRTLGGSPWFSSLFPGHWEHLRPIVVGDTGTSPALRAI